MSISSWETITCRLEVTPDKYPDFIEAIDDEADVDLQSAGFYIDLFGEDSCMAGKVVEIEPCTDPDDGEISFRCRVIIDRVELRGVGSSRGESQLREALRYATGVLQAVAYMEEGNIKVYNFEDGELKTRSVSQAEVIKMVLASWEAEL